MDKKNDYGVGEILLNCIEKDGMMKGFDIEFINSLSQFSKVPVICSSGAGNLQHIEELVKETNCDAICIGSAFHYNKIKIHQIKSFLNKKDYIIR